MITDAFDNSEVLFGTKDFYGEQKHLCDKCMIIFSEQIFEYMLDTYEHQEVGVIRCCNGITPVYVFDIEGMKNCRIFKSYRFCAGRWRCNRCELAYWCCEVHYVRLGRIIRQWADNR